MIMIFVLIGEWGSNPSDAFEEVLGVFSTKELAIEERDKHKAKGFWIKQMIMK